MTYRDYDSRPAPVSGAHAISYLRFSTARQQYGESLRRQLALADSYARRHGLILDSLTYRDLGVSAFRGKNAFRGSLSALLTAVRSNRIAPGTYLLIESFDRLSRQSFHAGRTILQELLAAGLIVVTLQDERIYAGELDLEQEMLIMIVLSRAHEESVTKSARLLDSWSARRAAAATGAPISREIPGWLDLAPDRSHFIVIPDRADSVRRVFDLYTAGWGATKIARLANSEKWPVPSRKSKNGAWHTSLINRITQNRAVLGEYQPHKIERKRAPDGEYIATYKPAGPAILDYYPRIISDEVFSLAEARRVTSADFPGRTDASTLNVLKGILFCTCGASVKFHNKTSKKQKNYALYYCSNRPLERCDQPGIHYLALQRAVIHSAAYHIPETFGDTPRAREISNELLKIDADLANNAAHIANLLLLLKSRKSTLSIVQRSCDEAEAEQEALQTRALELRAELSAIQSHHPEIVYERLRAGALDTESSRVQLREVLTRGIERIELDARARFARIYYKYRPEAAPVAIDNAGISTLLSDIAASQPDFIESLLPKNASQ